jgi:histidinol-phosphatase (PHP family)
VNISTDFHSHVSHTSALQMVRAAKEKGLQVLGISEHIYQLYEYREGLEHLPTEGPCLHVADYIQQIREAARLLSFDVRLGLEVDFIPSKHEAIQLAIQSQPWDFLIGSIHEIDELQFEENYSWSREEGEALWTQYFKLLQEAILSGCFQVVSHPVRMGLHNPHLPSTFDRELEQLASVAANSNVALEINGKDMRVCPLLVYRLAQACVKHHTSISVGSDAHYPEKVAQSHKETEQLLSQIGIRRVRVWKQREAEEYSL